MRPFRAFSLGAGGLVLAAIGWLAAAAQPQNDFRFSILGDRTGNAEPHVYESIWRDVERLHPNFVINVGDSIQGGNDATAEAEWSSLRALWDRYKLPLYLVPGNHDIWSDASRKVYEKASGHPAFYGFNYQDAHFTVLDNSVTENLSDAQMEFLARDLENNKARDPKFVFFHKPFWLIPVKFQSSEFPFHKLAQEYGVRYVVSGHGHQYVCLKQDGIVYLEAGSSGGRLKGQGFEKGWFFGQIVTEVKGSTVEMTAKEVDAPLGKGRTFKMLPEGSGK